MNGRRMAGKLVKETNAEEVKSKAGGELKARDLKGVGCLQESEGSGTGSGDKEDTHPTYLALDP